MRTAFNLSIFIGLTLILTACLQDPSYLQAKTLNGKTICLSKSKYLTQSTRGGLSSPIYAFYDILPQTYSNGTGKIPSLELYQSNPQQWHQWQGDTLFGQLKIINITPAGTKLRITDVSTSVDGGGFKLWIKIVNQPSISRILYNPENSTPKEGLRGIEQMTC